MNLYDVTYTLATESHINDRALRCIVEGGVTTTDDFPTMISVHHFGSAEYAASVAILESEFIASL